ncbi:MAG TPA: DUF6599 family protein [Bacteroidales bacterium]|nr:DUF6599 family protein [Bacteroidales bacterium]
MRKYFVVAILTAAVFITSLPAQDISFPELKGYKKNTDFPVYTSNNLNELRSSLVETFLSYRFVDMNIAEYRKGKNKIRVEISRHADNLMAFGIYSLGRSSSFRFLNLGSQGYSAEGVVNFFKGQFYVHLNILPWNEKNIQMAESLALRIANMLPGYPEMPAILTRLPETGRKTNEETFINENVLGHKLLAGAFKAVYEVGPDIFSLYLIENHSASETWKMAEAYLKQAGEDIPESETGKYVISDGYNGTVFLAWSNKTMIIITGLAKDQADVADKYTSEILE